MGARRVYSVDGSELEVVRGGTLTDQGTPDIDSVARGRRQRAAVAAAARTFVAAGQEHAARVAAGEAQASVEPDYETAGTRNHSELAKAFAAARAERARAIAAGEAQPVLDDDD